MNTLNIYLYIANDDDVFNLNDIQVFIDVESVNKSHYKKMFVVDSGGHNAGWTEPFDNLLPYENMTFLEILS